MAEPATVAELLLERAGDTTTGLRFEDGTWTWAEVVAESRRRASVLTGLRGRGPFHIGVLLENVPEYLFLLGGAALAGATIVGINPTRRGAELASDIRHTDCQVVLTDAAQASLLEGLDTGASVLLVDGDEYRRRLDEAGTVELGRADDGRALPPPDALYLLLFTSGSTGAPKAVKVSQGRLAEAGSTMATGFGFGPGDVLYCAMPLFHGNALNIVMAPAFASGATVVLRRRFSASGFLPDVRRYGVTFFNYVGRALTYVLATPARPDDGDNTLKFAMGTDASSQDAAAFRRRFGCFVVEGYGSSEGAIAMSPVPGMPRGALGLPPADTDVVVVDEAGVERPRARFDEEGRLVNPSEAIGEIVSRDGAGRFEGYYANPEAEAERTRQGWYWSGDLGYRDEDGYFYFAGRTSDWLRVDGENFAAAPVERILERHPAVRVAVVYGVPDPRTGDQVMAALELEDPEAFDAGAFAGFLAGQPDLGTKWPPRFLRLVRRVPVTGTGKVDKRPLRADRWRAADPIWWWPPADRRPAYRRLEPADADRLDAELEAHGRSAYLTT